MILVKKTPLGEIRRNKRLVIFNDDLQDYVLSPRRDSDGKALIGDSCTTTLYQVPDNTTNFSTFRKGTLHTLTPILT
jgi:hypothetical protein